MAFHPTPRALSASQAPLERKGELQDLTLMFRHVTWMPLFPAQEYKGTLARRQAGSQQVPAVNSISQGVLAGTLERLAGHTQGGPSPDWTVPA